MIGKHGVLQPDRPLQTGVPALHGGIAAKGLHRLEVQGEGKHPRLGLVHPYAVGSRPQGDRPLQRGPQELPLSPHAGKEHDAPETQRKQHGVGTEGAHILSPVVEQAAQGAMYPPRLTLEREKEGGRCRQPLFRFFARRPFEKHCPPSYQKTLREKRIALFRNSSVFYGICHTSIISKKQTVSIVKWVFQCVCGKGAGSGLFRCGSLVRERKLVPIPTLGMLGTLRGQIVEMP